MYKFKVGIIDSLTGDTEMIGEVTLPIIYNLNILKEKFGDRVNFNPDHVEMQHYVNHYEVVDKTTKYVYFRLYPLY